MANPRKFSEKIALHNQKQAEETAAFEKIMREVSDATARSALSNLEEMNAGGRDVGGLSGSPNTGSGPSSGGGRSGGSGSQGRASSQVVQERGRSMGVGPMRGSRPGGEKRIDTSPYGSAAYLSPPPATDATSWRRTNSDSALHHHSIMSSGGGGSQGGSNTGIDNSLHLGQGSPRRAIDGQYLGFSGSSGGVEGGGPIGPCDPGGGGRTLLLSSSSSSPLGDGGGRPRSCCEVPRVPGINWMLDSSIYPTSSQQEPGTLQIPSGNNTGSLPDLTNFHFPSPLPTPLDVEDHNSSSPYSSNSPQGGTSPTTLSPTSGALSTSPRQHPAGKFSFNSSSPESPIPIPQGGLSPGHSPTPNHRQPHQQPNMASNLAHSPNHLSVPSLVNSSYLHSCKGVTFDNSSNMQMGSFHQKYIYHQPQTSNHPQNSDFRHRQQQPQCSPPLMPNSQSIPTHMSSMNYRSSHVNRPSPQSSPGLTVPQNSPLGGYRSTSPGGRVSPHSAPQSPISPSSSPGNQTSAPMSSMPSHQHRHSASSPSPSSPSPSPSSSSSTSAITTNSSSVSQEQQNNYYLVEQLQQFSMLDNPPSTSIDFIGSQSNSMNYSQASPSISVVGSPDDGGGGMMDGVGLACLGLDIGLGLSCGNTIGRIPHQDTSNMGQATDGGYYSRRQSPSSPSSVDPSRQSQQQHHHPHHHPHHHQNQQQLQFDMRQLPSILSQPPPQPLDPIGGGGGGGGNLSESGHHTAPQTPNTPTSIPDIILTDFSSGAGDDISARTELTKDLNRVLAAAGAGAFDSANVIGGEVGSETSGIIGEDDLSHYSLDDEEAIRQGLGPIDLDSLHILTQDMNSITDPATEDHFRHDRL